MLHRVCLPCVALLSACAALLPQARSAPQSLVRKPRIEVCFVVDTTGSMGGYIAYFQQKYWPLLNLIASGQPAPDLKVALVDYRDKGDAWITKLFDFTPDLDAQYSNLLQFRADGGGDTPEHVNQAVYDTVHKLRWSKDPRTLKMVFLIADAGPHMDYKDDVKYPETCKEAVKRGIVFHTIQCGSDSECQKHFKEIAAQSRGGFVQLGGAGNATPYTTPQDRRLHEINAELLRGVIPWGTDRGVQLKKVQQGQGLSLILAADRISLMARQRRVASYDLLDSLRSGAARLENLREEDLPAEVRKANPAERREAILKLTQKRAPLLREASDLGRLRMRQLLRDIGSAATSFDHKLFAHIRNQARRTRVIDYGAP